MIIETLPRSTFDENLQDFKRCEGKWRDVKETNIDESFLMRSFRFVVEELKMTNQDTSNYEWENIKSNLEAGRVVADMFLFYRIKNDLPKCPLCGASYNRENHEYATSRRDNETEICSLCGIREAIEDVAETRG